MATLKNFTKLLLFLTYGTVNASGPKEGLPLCYCQNKNTISYVNTTTGQIGIINKTVGSCYLLNTPKNKTSHCWDTPNLACYLDTRSENRPRDIGYFICQDETSMEDKAMLCDDSLDWKAFGRFGGPDCVEACKKFNGDLEALELTQDFGAAKPTTAKIKWCRLATSLTPGH
jgi:hypothetical protein